VVADLATDWTISRAGRRWTVRIRPDATWHDGAPVTADDVVFTVRSLKSPAYEGPRAASWEEVTARKIDPLTVQFDLATPLAGFLEALRLPLLPEHLLRGVPMDELADSPFSVAPVGSGPYRLLRWDTLSATLEAVASAQAPGGTDSEGSSSADGSVTAEAPGSAPSAAPAAAGALPSAAASSAALDPPRIELRFYEEAERLSAAYLADEVDIAEGLPPATTLALAQMPGSRLLRYPAATATVLVLNQRPDHPEFRDVAVRRALLGAVDRVRIVREVAAGMGIRADSPIPPGSWAFDGEASKPVAYNTPRAARALKGSGWTKVDGFWRAPGAKRPFVIEVICADQVSNPVVFAAARLVALSWKSFGFKTRLVPLTPAVLVGERLSQADFSVAVLDMNVGLDPDLFPLLASRQAGTSGANLMGVQSLVLDARLVAARKPGSTTQRRRAYSDLQAFLAETQVLPGLFFRDDAAVISNRVVGGVRRLIGDPSDRFWDVLTWRLATAR